LQSVLAAGEFVLSETFLFHFFGPKIDQNLYVRYVLVVSKLKNLFILVTRIVLWDSERALHLSSRLSTLVYYLFINLFVVYIVGRREFAKRFLRVAPILSHIFFPCVRVDSVLVQESDELFLILGEQNTRDQFKCAQLLDNIEYINFLDQHLLGYQEFFFLLGEPEPWAVAVFTTEDLVEEPFQSLPGTRYVKVSYPFFELDARLDFHLFSR